MAFTHVQTAHNGADSSSVVVTCSATSAGNLVVVSIATDSPAHITSVTDSAGNTYASSHAEVTIPGSYSVVQYYGVQAVGGSTTVTVHASLVENITAVIDEFSGTASGNSGVFDKASINTGSSTTSSSVASFSPSATGELIVAAIGLGLVASNPISFTAGTSYTLGDSVTSNDTTTFSEYRLSGGSPETSPASWTNSANYGEVASAFLAFIGTYTLSTSDTVTTSENIVIQKGTSSLNISDTTVTSESTNQLIESIVFVSISDNTIASENIKSSMPISVTVGPLFQSINGPLVKVA